METLTRESKPYMSGEYADIFQASATGNLTSEEALKYSESYFKELDNQSSLRFTAKKNRAEGEAEERRQSIRFMLSFIIPTEEIAKKYGITEEEVMRIAKEK